MARVLVLTKSLTHENATSLAAGGRFAVITFHSLEDRIVKNQFRFWADSKEGRLIHKKIISPKREEMIDNRRSRSAKLRSVEKIS